MGHIRDDENDGMGMDGGQQQLGQNTRLLAANDHTPYGGSFTAPVFPTSTFVFPTCLAGEAAFDKVYMLGKQEILLSELRAQGVPIQDWDIYTRVGNPSIRMPEKMLCAIEQSDWGILFPAGMNAILSLCLCTVRAIGPRDTILHSGQVYGGTHLLFTGVCWNMGWNGVEADMRDPEQLRAAIRANKDRIGLIFLESPSNPSLQVYDIAALRQVIDQEYGQDEERPVFAVDNTFAGTFQTPRTPYDGLPGADVVVYSATKYLGGHSNLTAGMLAGWEGYTSRVRLAKDADDLMLPLEGALLTHRAIGGFTPDPHMAFMLQTQMQSYHVRMQRQSETATALAAALADHPKVQDVRHPSLFTGRDGEIVAKQMTGGSGMISLRLRDDTREAAYRFGDNTETFARAVSLGCVNSLFDIAATWTHSDIPIPEQRKLGITPSHLRLSVGFEDPQDLIHDVEQALEHV